MKQSNRYFNLYKVIIGIALFSFFSCNDDDASEPLVTTDFSATATAILEGKTITFKDLSVGETTQWEWTFEGGVPATSMEQNPVITYNSEGDYSVTLKASNSGNSATETKASFIKINENLPWRLENIRTDFISKMETAGLAAPFTPQFLIQNPDEPTSLAFYAYYNHSDKVIAVPKWETIDTQTQNLMADWATLAANSNNSEALFKKDLNEYVVAQLLGFYAQLSADNNANNNFYLYSKKGNEIAVAYWMTVEGGESKLQELVTGSEKILNSLENPVPTGMSDEEYFNNNVGSVVTSTERFIYLQYKLRIAAFNKRNDLNFSQTIQGL